MVLQPPRAPGTDAFIRIYNNDGSESERLRQRHALRRQAGVRRHRRHGADVRNPRRAAAMLARPGAEAVHRRHGHAEIRLAGDSARRGVSRHARRSNCRSARSTRRCCIRRRSSAWAIRMRSSGSTTSMPTISAGSGRCWKTIRSFRSAPTSRWPTSSIASHIVIRTWERGAGLTKACGSAACATAVAAARLKRTERTGADHAARRRAHDRMARERRSRADDRRRRASNSKAGSIRRCSPPPPAWRSRSSPSAAASTRIESEADPPRGRSRRLRPTPSWSTPAR